MKLHIGFDKKIIGILVNVTTTLDRAMLALHLFNLLMTPIKKASGCLRMLFLIK